MRLLACSLLRRGRERYCPSAQAVSSDSLTRGLKSIFYSKCVFLAMEAFLLKKKKKDNRCKPPFISAPPPRKS